MISDGAIKAVIAVIAKCEEGVDYVPGVGAICPECGAVLSTTKTCPEQDGLRVRYHRCRSALCIVRMLQENIKSIEVLG